MSIYRALEVQTWHDPGFLALSPAKPNAQTLWLRLLTGPETTPIPGLVRTTLGGLADALGWPHNATRKCWLELEAKPMAKADWRAGLVWLPGAVGRRQNNPASVNAAKSWGAAARELPPCDLLNEAVDAWLAFMSEALPDGFRQAFRDGLTSGLRKASDRASGMASGKASRMASPMPSRIQESGIQESGISANKQPLPTTVGETRAPVGVVGLDSVPSGRSQALRERLQYGDAPRPPPNVIAGQQPLTVSVNALDNLMRSGWNPDRCMALAYGIADAIADGLIEAAWWSGLLFSLQRVKRDQLKLGSRTIEDGTPWCDAGIAAVRYAAEKREQARKDREALRPATPAERPNVAALESELGGRSWARSKPEPEDAA